MTRHACLCNLTDEEWRVLGLFLCRLHIALYCGQQAPGCSSPNHPPQQPGAPVLYDDTSQPRTASPPTAAEPSQVATASGQPFHMSQLLTTWVIPGVIWLVLLVCNAVIAVMATRNRPWRMATISRCVSSTVCNSVHSNLLLPEYGRRELAPPHKYESKVSIHRNLLDREIFNIHERF